LCLCCGVGVVGVLCVMFVVGSVVGLLLLWLLFVIDFLNLCMLCLSEWFILGSCFGLKKIRMIISRMSSFGRLI